MGVLIRATMQNRDMAQSLGVRTRNVDRFTFAMGAGIAGVAGYGWTIVGELLLTWEASSSSWTLS